MRKMVPNKETLLEELRRLQIQLNMAAGWASTYEMKLQIKTEETELSNGVFNVFTIQTVENVIKESP